MENKELKKWVNSHNFIVGVPCSKLNDLIPYDRAIIATREDEALGMAIGAKLMGKNPLLFIQDSGLGNCLTLLTSILKYYTIKIDILISIRKYPIYHGYMGNITKQILKLMDYKNYKYIIEK